MEITENQKLEKLIFSLVENELITEEEIEALRLITILKQNADSLDTQFGTCLYDEVCKAKTEICRMLGSKIIDAALGDYK